MIVSVSSKYEIDAAIIGAWTWPQPMLVKEFIRKFLHKSIFR